MKLNIKLLSFFIFIMCIHHVELAGKNICPETEEIGTIVNAGISEYRTASSNENTLCSDNVISGVNCDITINYTQSSCSDDGSGNFTAVYDLILNWEDPPTTGDLSLTLYGDGTLNTTTVSAATIAGGTSTTLTAAFTVPADGEGTTGILATFDDDLTCKDSIDFKSPLACPTEINITATGLFCYQNLALSGTATQSSTFPSFTADLANDDILSNLTSTDLDMNPFWQVDLGSVQTIDSIIVYRRTGTNTALENGIVEVLDASNTVVFTHTLGTGLPEDIPISTGGVTGQTVRVRLETESYLQLREVQVLQNISCTQERAICEFSSTTNIVGQAWQDVNCNGDMDEIEFSATMAGVQGVEVQLTDCEGNLVGTTYTDKNGSYIFDNTNANEVYRVEFILPESISCWAQPTHTGSDNGSTVQFVQSGSCASLGIANPSDYCDDNPILMTSCFVNGEALGGTQTGGIDAFVAVPLNFTGNGNAGSDNQYLANMEDVGAVWGVAVQKSTRTIFTSSVLKRQVSFGPANNTPGTTQHTTGGIYAIDYSNPATPSSMLWLDLNAVAGISTGADPHTGLDGDPAVSNRDPAAFGQVGKIALGDLEISEDGTKLYAMNLNERTLIEIDIATKAILNQYPIPNTGCTNSDNTIVAALHFRDSFGDIIGKGQTWVNGLAQLTGETGFEDTFLDPAYNPTDAPTNIFRDPATGPNLSLPITLANGTYEVSLYFRGDEFSPGSRVFDISLEGTLVADDYDITFDNRAKFNYTLLNNTGTSNGGFNALHRVANVQKFTTTVSDGVLNINLDGVVGDAAFAAVKIKSLDITPNTAPTDHRPWAIGINKGKIYVGSVCSGETSELVDDVTANVLELNGNTFTEVLSFPMNYDRAFASRGAGNSERMARWNAWSDDNTYATWDASISSTLATLSYAQPILSAIDFDANDNLLLGITDRLGHQVGYDNVTPTLDENILEFAHTAGDILKACKNGSTWVIEGDAACPQAFSGTSNNLIYQGINGGEFFGEDYTAIDADGNNLHDETAWGTLTYLSATNQVVSLGMDPKGVVNSGGLIWYNVDDGTYVKGYEIYGDAVSSGSSPQLFGKANGLGDIELLCAAAPLEIGNYVWCDSIQNGVQDACERGINSINVSLYDRNGNLVGLTQTSTTGQYYFNENNVDTTGVDAAGAANTAYTGMSYSSQYFIVFGNGQFNSTDLEFNNGSEIFGISSIVDAGSNDNIDSDVDGSNLTAGILGLRPEGLPFIDMTTSATGCGDHKYDMGVTCTPSYSLGNQVFTDTDNSGNLNGSEMGIDGVQLQLLNSDGTIYDSDPIATGDQALTVTTSNGGYYRFDDLPAGDYIVEVIASNFTTTNPLENLISSTGANQEADPNTDGDLNDNGLDTPVGGAIRSGIVTLGNPEPTSETEPSSYGAASTTGTAAIDENSNLTVDFGFYLSCTSIAIGTTSNPTNCSAADGTIQITGMTANTAYSLNFIKDGVSQSTQNITSDGSGNFTMIGLESATYSSINVTEGGCTSNNLTTIIPELNCDYQDYLATCNNPPCHIISADLYLGNGVSSDMSTTGSIAADTDDDDGILFPNDIRPGITVQFPVSIYNNTGQSAYLNAWIDWNGDQDFDDAGEQIANETYDYASYNGSFKELITITVPSNVPVGQNIAIRYRLSTNAADINSPCNSAACAIDGEIEDYLIKIECPPVQCLPVQLAIKRG